MQDTKLRCNVINYIRAVCDSLVESNLEPEHTNLYQGTMLDLEEYFGTNEVQTWIMCFAVYQHFNYGVCASFHDFAEFLGSNVLDVVNMHEDFMALRKRGFVDYSEISSSFQVNENIVKYVIGNVRIPATFTHKQTYTEGVSEKIY